MKSHVSARCGASSAVELFSFLLLTLVFLVRSHLPAEEHTQTQISEDCEKEGCDIICLFIYLVFHPACPLSFCRGLFSILFDDPSISKAVFQQDIYISWNRRWSKSEKPRLTYK